MEFPKLQLTLLKSNILAITLIMTISTMLIGLVILLNLWKEIPIGTLTRDPISAAGAPFYTGFFSQIGIFFWATSAAICFFCALVIPKGHRNYRTCQFLFVSGLVTLLLGFDDAFLLHESVFPYFGVPELIIYSIYVGLIISYLVIFLPTILKTDYILLVMALFFFGLSVGLDILQIPYINPYIIEDGSKMVGLVSWFFYFLRTTTNTISNRLNTKD